MHFRLLVEGVVQGVNYRWLVKQIAQEMGLKGWVKNLQDGRVEIVCDCSESELEEFKKKIHRKREGFFGPHVEKISVEKIPKKEDFIHFEIRY